MKCVCVVFVVTFLLHNEFTTAYKATVVEYSPAREPEPTNTILKNLNNYRDYVQKAQGSDIIVFPEYGLTSIVDDVEEYAIDIANNTNNIIQELKDMAIEHNIYIVVNLLEKEAPSNKKTKYYNTNLVFNRKGEIQAKYRKINLYNEPALTPGDEVVTFTSDFAVNFGIFTCADILYYKPSRSILEYNNVSDIIFPTAWSSALPFYNALSVQHGYVLSTGVNLLAANYGNPKEGLGGSGIYYGDGTIGKVYIDSTKSSIPLDAVVSTLNGRQKPTSCVSKTSYGLPVPDDEKPSIKDFNAMIDFKSSDYTFENIDLSQSNLATSICHKEFCCNFTITIDTSTSTNEYYKLVAYDGPATFLSEDTHVRFCSLIACKDDSKSSCGQRVDATTKFKKITVSGSLDLSNTTFYTPVTLKNTLKPVTETSYCETTDVNSMFIKLDTYRSQDGVLAFGLWGNVNAGNVNAASSIFNFGFLMLLYFAVGKFVLL